MGGGTSSGVKTVDKRYIFGEGEPVNGKSGCRMFVEGNEAVLQVEDWDGEDHRWNAFEARMPQTNLRQAVERLASTMGKASYRGDGFKMEMVRQQDGSGQVELKLEPGTTSSTPGGATQYFSFNITVNLAQLREI